METTVAISGLGPASILGTALLFLSGAAAGQEADPPDVEQDDVPRTESGECFTTSDLVDMTVLDERSVYVRTRTRHFLLGSSRQCDNLRRAYDRNAVGFVPLGRRICPNDGSHFRYETGGRARMCPIAEITEVASLAQAQELAASRARSADDLIVTQDIDPSDDEE